MIGDQLDRAQTVFDGPQNGVGRDRDTVQSDFRRATAVLCRIGAQGDPVGLGINQKQADARAITPGARDPCADDQPIGGVGVEGDRLVSSQHEAVAVRPGRGGDVEQVVTGLAFRMGEGKFHVAGGDLRQYLIALRLGPRRRDQSGADDHRR